MLRNITGDTVAESTDIKSLSKSTIMLNGYGKIFTFSTPFIAQETSRFKAINKPALP